MKILAFTTLFVLNGFGVSAWALSTSRTELNLKHESYFNSRVSYFSNGEKTSEMSTAGLALDYAHRRGRRRSQVNLEAFHSFAEDASYLNVREMYVDFSSGEKHLIFGRKKTDFSEADEFWEMGLWQPRFLWNRAHPTSEGLIGVFYRTSTNPQTQFTFFASVINVPELGPKYREREGRLFSSNPWFRSPPPEANVFDQSTDIYMTVQEPEATDALFLPSFALRMDREINERVQWGGSYGLKPMNQPMMALEYKLRIEEGSQIAAVKVHPYIAYHHIATADVTFQTRKWFSMLSGTIEEPFGMEDDSTKISQQLASMFLATWIWSYNLQGEGVSATKVYGGLLKTWGSVADDYGEDSRGATQFEIRSRWLEAYRLGLQYPLWSKHRPLRNKIEVTYDRLQNGATFTSHFEYNLYDAWMASLSVDLLGVFDSRETDLDTAFIRQYRANDLVALGLSYVY